MQNAVLCNSQSRHTGENHSRLALATNSSLSTCFSLALLLCSLGSLPPLSLPFSLSLGHSLYPTRCIPPHSLFLSLSLFFHTQSPTSLSHTHTHDPWASRRSGTARPASWHCPRRGSTPRPPAEASSSARGWRQGLRARCKPCSGNRPRTAGCSLARRRRTRRRRRSQRRQQTIARRRGLTRRTGRRTQPGQEESEATADDPGEEQAKLLLLVDTVNGFNNLSRLAMLWTIRHHWPKMAWFAYRHQRRLYVQCAGLAVIIIFSMGGRDAGRPVGRDSLRHCAVPAD